MDFKKINEHLIDNQPTTFLNAVLAQTTEKDAFFIFSQASESQFEQNLQYLLSDETISLQELLNWKIKGFLIVAQTIDGDYVAGTESQTFIIPVSLYKSDIEIYDMPLGEFFSNYSRGTINSTILPSD